MQDLIIQEGWLSKDKTENVTLKILCEHKVNTVCIDYEIGIEHCGFCGALGTYNMDTDSLDWKLPEYFTKRGYN